MMSSLVSQPHPLFCSNMLGAAKNVVNLLTNKITDYQHTIGELTRRNKRVEGNVEQLDDVTCLLYTMDNYCK